MYVLLFHVITYILVISTVYHQDNSKVKMLNNKIKNCTFSTKQI